MDIEVSRCILFNCNSEVVWWYDKLCWFPTLQALRFLSIAGLSRNISCCNIFCGCFCTEYICIRVHSSNSKSVITAQEKVSCIWYGNFLENTSWMLGGNKKRQILGILRKGMENNQPHFSSLLLKFSVQIWWSCLSKVTVKLIKSKRRTRRMVEVVKLPVSVEKPNRLGLLHEKIR